jgi:transcriptional regulator
MPQPRLLWERPNDPDYVRRLEKGTVGFRLTPTRVVAKRKLSQNRPDEVVETIIAGLEAGGGPYADPRLPAEMRRDLDVRKAAR